MLKRAIRRFAYIPQETYQLRTETGRLPGTKKELVGENGTIVYHDDGVDDHGFDVKDIRLGDYFYGNQNHTHNVFYGTKAAQARQARKIENRTFVDLRILRVSSGDGGSGCVSFFRDANAPVGPPDGGDGGAGGNVYLSVVDSGVKSLHRLTRTYTAGTGTSGKGSQLDGKHGDDVIIEVPVGTTLRWLPDPLELKRFLSRREGKDVNDVVMRLKTTGNKIQMFRGDYGPGEGWKFTENNEEYYQGKEYFSELDEKVREYDEGTIRNEIEGDRFPLVGIDCDKPSKKPILLLEGGSGGLGNMHFLTPNIRNPRFAKCGRKGLTGYFLLELKLIADLGLVGLPNAGKSSLLRAISKARPRVGHWEFTTLQPTVGTISTSIDSEPFTVADIPGIIAGASENKGMGLDFLRHIERSRGLVLVVSLESADPVADLNTLITEVGSRIDGKQILVVATKADLSDGANYQRLLQAVEKNHWKIVPVCAPQGHNVEKCIQLMESSSRQHR